MDTLKLTFEGISPLLMHSARGADPLDPLTREMKTYSSQRKKTDEIHAKMARCEWELGLYFDEEMGVYIPTTNLRATIIEGGKLSKLGMDLKRATMVDSDRTPLKHAGPKSIQDLWDKGTYRDARSVVVGKARVMRTRPIFRKWSCSFSMLYNAEVIQRDKIIESAEKAGAMVGIGDYRPTCGGPYGRFSVKVDQ